MQNDRQRCKIKVREFLFDILWRFRVTEKNLGGGGAYSVPPVRIGLNCNKSTFDQIAFGCVNLIISTGLFWLV